MCSFIEEAEKVAAVLDAPVRLSEVFRERKRDLFWPYDPLIRRCAIARRDVIAAVFGKYPIGRLSSEQRFLLRFVLTYLNRKWHPPLPNPELRYGGLSGRWRVRKGCSYTDRRRGYEIVEDAVFEFGWPDEESP